MKATRNVLGCLSLNVIQFSIRKFSENLILTHTSNLLNFDQNIIFTYYFIPKLALYFRNSILPKCGFLVEIRLLKKLGKILFLDYFFSLEFWKNSKVYRI